MLSVVIIAKNEAKMIKTCLDSVKWVDEIVVIDNQSTDETSKIAEKYTKKIYITDVDSFSGKREFALDKVEGDWILFVDADERVLAPLREEIEKLIHSEPDESAWAIPRRNVIFGQEVKYAAFWPDYVIRLFKKNRLKGYQGEVHEQPVFDGKLAHLKNPFLHLTHRDVESVMLKSLSWSKIDAKLRLDADHPPMSGWRFLRILFTELFEQGIRRRGFFHGTVGVIDSLLQVFSLVLTYMRLWEMQQSASLTDQYQQIDNQLENDHFRF